MKRIAFLPILTFIITSVFSCSNDEDFSGISYNPSIVQPCDSFTDIRDGHKYKCVQIGNQIWMAENLNYLIPGGQYSGCWTWNENEADTTKFVLTWQERKQVLKEISDEDKYDWSEYDSFFKTGSELIFDLSVQMTDDASAEYSIASLKKDYPEAYKVDSAAEITRLKELYPQKYQLFGQKADADAKNYSATYGRLYTYEAAFAAVPEGWRLPSDADWQKMERAIGMSEKESNKYNEWRGEGSRNILKKGGESGFDAIFGGGDVYVKPKEHKYIGKFESGYWWTSDIQKENDSVNLGTFRILSIKFNKIWRGSTRIDNVYRKTSYSVRCVKDVETPTATEQRRIEATEE